MSRFFTVSVEEIPEMQVIMTGLSGQIVNDRDQLANPQRAMEVTP